MEQQLEPSIGRFVLSRLPLKCLDGILRDLDYEPEFRYFFNITLRALDIVVSTNYPITSATYVRRFQYPEDMFSMPTFVCNRSGMVEIEKEKMLELFREFSQFKDAEFNVSATEITTQVSLSHLSAARVAPPTPGLRSVVVTERDPPASYFDD